MKTEMSDSTNSIRFDAVEPGIPFLLSGRVFVRLAQQKYLRISDLADPEFDPTVNDGHPRPEETQKFALDVETSCLVKVSPVQVVEVCPKSVLKIIRG
jgi:hypothetical protein